MRTTQRQFILFEKWCRYWIEKFGLTEYEIGFEHRRFNPKGLWACTFYDTGSGKYAVFVLYKGWSIGKREWKTIPDEEIMQVAFHEVGHLLLADLMDLIWLGKSRRRAKALREEHRLIAKLGSVLLWNRK